MTTHVITLPGKPHRWKIGLSKHKRGTYNPNYAVKQQMRQLILEQLGNPELIEIPVKSRIAFYFAMPKSWSKRKRAVMLGMPMAIDPDLDNIEKFLNDCLTKTVLADDNLVCKTTKFKAWAEESCTIVQVEEIDLREWRNQHSLEMSASAA